MSVTHPLRGLAAFIAAFIAAAVVLSTPAVARTNDDTVVLGRTNRDGGGGCTAGCHGAGAVTTLLSGPFQGAMSRGEVATLTASVFSGAANGTRLGMAIATGTNGALSVNPGQSMKTAGTNELIHATSVGALPTTVGGGASYSFRFTMPADATVGSTHTIYAVSAVGFVGTSHATNRTIVVRPIAPTSVTASNVTTGSVNLSWVGVGPQYRVVYKTGSVPPSGENDGTGNDYGTATSTTITGLSATTQYSFAVFSKLATDTIYSSTAASTTATTLTPVTGPRFVNATTGNDTGDCRTQVSPCKTVSFAMAQATGGTPGDAVNVAPGTYNVALGEVFPITIKSGVQLKATGNAANTTLDATGANQRVFEVEANAHSTTLLEGFTITGGLVIAAEGGLAFGGALRMPSGGSPTIRKNVFLANEARGYAGSSPTFVSGGQGWGGALYIQGTPTIVNNVFRGNIARGGQGVSRPGDTGGSGGDAQGGAIHYSGGGGSITNNTFYGNSAIGGNGGASQGVTAAGGNGGSGNYGALVSTGVNVDNNIFANNSAVAGSGGGGSPPGSTGSAGYGAMQYNSPPTSASNNLFHGNTAAGVASTGDTIGTNSRCFLSGGCASVLFHSEPTNLRLQPASPAAGQGTATGAPTDDFEGVTRPNPPSIGAYEASSTSIVYNMVLEGWQQVAPYVVTNATGTGTATFNTVTKQLTLNLPYSGLGSAEVGAHIHGPAARGANAGILFTLAAGSPKTDVVTLSAAQETQLNAGQLYVNIHTSTYAAGEIRAQIDNVGATVTRALTVTKSGTGSGTVTGTAEPGTVINCGGDCSETVPNGKQVTLTAAAAAGSSFTGWSGGGCSGTGNCVVTMTAATTVTATFVTDPTVTYNLVLEGWQQVAPYVVTNATGTGTAIFNTVTKQLTLNLPYSGLGSAEVGAHIHGPAARGANAGVLFTLAAGSPKTDVVTLSAAQETQLNAGQLYVNIHTSTYAAGEIRAQIDNVGATVTRALTVAKAGTGSGTVTGTAEPGTVINCGSDCTETVPDGKAVTLAASAAAGSVFAGWSGGGCSGTGNCVATMTAAATVTATFNTVASAPAVSLSTTTVDFGGQSMGTTSPATTVTVTNSGNATLTISSITVSEAQFAQANNCTSLAAAASCTITITFSPTVTGAALNASVSVTGTLTITSNAASSPSGVSLAGTAEKSLVSHFYRAILERAPESGGHAFWHAEAQRLASQGANPNETWFVMANYFFNSPEYVALAKSDTQFLGDLYRTFFNRAPDGGGLGFWQSQITAGLSREGVTFWFMFSSEFRGFAQSIFGNTAARPEIDMVMDLFRGILNRFPENAALAAFVGTLRAAQCAPAAQRAGAVYTAVNDISYYFLFGSSEYAARNRTNTQYVSDMYNAFLRRGGANDEMAFWINRLDSGARDRNLLRTDFIASPEFGARVQAVIDAGCLQ